MSRRKSFNDYTAIGSIAASWVMANLPFVFFLGFVGTLYIANVQYGETRMRNIKDLQDDIKDLRYEYMSLKSELMFNSKKSEVEKRVENIGLKGVNVRPKVIVVEE